MTSWQIVRSGRIVEGQWGSSPQSPSACFSTLRVETSRGAPASEVRLLVEVVVQRWRRATVHDVQDREIVRVRRRLSVGDPGLTNPKFLPV